MTDVIEHQGIIVDIKGNTAKVKILQKSACSACHVKDLCNASETTEKIIEANTLSNEFHIGDKVLVIGKKNIAVQAVLLAYILPFCVIFATLIVLSQFISNEVIVGTCALCSLIPYLLFLRLIKKKIQAKFQFYISQI